MNLNESPNSTIQPTSTQSPRMIHHVGYMAIVLSILMFFSWFRLDIMTYWQIKFSWLLLIAVLIYYFFLNVRLAAVTSIFMIIVTAIMTWLAQPAPTTFSFILFLVLLIVGATLIFISSGFAKDKVCDQVKELLLMPYTVVSNLLSYFGVGSYLGLG